MPTQALLFGVAYERGSLRRTPRPARCRDAVHGIWDEILRPAITANAAHDAYAYLYDVDIQM